MKDFFEFYRKAFEQGGFDESEDYTPSQEYQPEGDNFPPNIAIVNEVFYMGVSIGKLKPEDIINSESIDKSNDKH